MTDLLRTVIEDLDHLREGWGTSLSEAEIRRGSPLLRRLLVDGQLKRAWTESGFRGQPRFEVRTFTRMLQEINVSLLEFASIGGAEINGMIIATPASTRTDLSEEQLERLSEASRPDRTENLNVDGYLDQPAVIVEGVAIQRRLVIKYVANKLGGAHYDEGRSGRGGEEFAMLDKLFWIELTGLRVVYHELASAAQLLARAPSLKGLTAVPQDTAGAVE